jgi:hypothetical protein
MKLSEGNAAALTAAGTANNIPERALRTQIADSRLIVRDFEAASS